LLLDGERVDADLTIISGIEALDVADDLFASLCGELLKRRVFREREVGAFPFFKAIEELEDVALPIAFLELAVFVAALNAIQAVGVEACFVDEVPEFLRVTMDKFGTQFEDLILLAHCEDASAEAVASFEYEYLAASLRETTRGGEAGHTGTDDQNALLPRIHHNHWMRPQFGNVRNRRPPSARRAHLNPDIGPCPNCLACPASSTLTELVKPSKEQ
jgi:hypothetical protein